MRIGRGTHGRINKRLFQIATADGVLMEDFFDRGDAGAEVKEETEASGRAKERRAKKGAAAAAGGGGDEVDIDDL